MAGVLALLLAGWQVFEARKLRREEFRPWVVVTFHFRSNIAFVAIRNVGRTVARGVELRFEPALVKSPLVSALEKTRAEFPGYSLPQLAPGEERLLLLDKVPDRLASDLPKRHEVTARYRDHRRKPLPADEFVLDLESLEGAKLPDKGLHEIAEAVAKIAK